MLDDYITHNTNINRRLQFNHFCNIERGNIMVKILYTFSTYVLFNEFLEGETSFLILHLNGKLNSPVAVKN